MKYAVFDIEAERWIRFRVLGFYDGVEYRTFFQVKDFLSHLNQKKYMHFRIYAHNAGRYDILFLYEEILRRGWRVRIIDRQGRIVAMYVNTGKITFHFADSYALLPESLRSLCEGFKVEHRKGDFKFTEGKKIDPHDTKLLKYLERDCFALYDVLTMFFSNEYIVKPQLTIASQALNTFTNLFLQSDVYETRLKIENEFRERWYRGGRVEVYKGEGIVNYYDVNSLFAHVMQNEMPMGECSPVHTYKKGCIGFYRVYISSTPNWYISPLIVHRDNGNYFVNGKGVYYLTSAMIDYLKTEWAIRCKVDYGYVFSKRAHIFNGYVNTFFDLKQKSKGSALYTIAKLFLVALYGKFGQTRTRYSVETHTNQKHFASYDDEWGLVLVERKSRSRFILPYLAAYITDLARLYHYKLMSKDFDSMFYCDTDSLLTSSTYDTGNGLGDLSCEGKYKGLFLAPKSYALKNRSEERIVLKGFEGDDVSFQDFYAALHEKRVLKSTGTRILGYAECKKNPEGVMRRKKGILESQGSFLHLVETEKVVRSEYNKRKVFPDRKTFFDTTPFTFSELKKES